MPSLGEEDGGVGGALHCFVSVRWCDQGWGNQKGMVSVVETAAAERQPAAEAAAEAAAQDDKSTLAAPGDYKPWGAWVVAGKEPAPHRMEPLRLSFPVRRGARYALWYRVGGGGGHSLRIENCSVHVVEHCLRG